MIGDARRLLVRWVREGGGQCRDDRGSALAATPCGIIGPGGLACLRVREDEANVWHRTGTFQVH